ncbi:unnamed protein product [Polarella glacialis]|uniref:C3H1-type domain-containing protein n=1 Tax=Polarella glacialis TaxID=89957 RepID=A0A813M016_POLGL|nr:unnamed protein product [Polarella glacialis]
MPGDAKSTPDQNARGQQPQQPQQQQQQEQQEQKPQLERQQQHDVLTNGLDGATTPPGGTSTLPVAAGSEAAQAASECPALAEERFELDFFAEVSVKNQFDLLTNCPHYATTSPGGASSLPSPVPNVAGSEAAEAVSEDPAFTAERPGPEFFPEASGEKQVEVITYGVDVAATPPGGASSAGAAGSGMIETVRDRQAGSASSSASVPSSGATASSAIVTASPSPVGVDDNIVLTTNGESYNNNNINFDNNNKNNKDSVVNSHISKKQRKQRLQQLQLQQLHLHEQQERQQQDDLCQQQQQLPLHQPYQREHPEQQPDAETPTLDEGTGTPAPAETYTRVDASRLWKRSSTSRRTTPRKENSFATANKFAELEDSGSEVGGEAIGTVHVSQDVFRSETDSHAPIPLTPPQPDVSLIGVVASEPQAPEAAGLADWRPRLGVATTTARYPQQQQQTRQPPLDAGRRWQVCASLSETHALSTYDTASLNGTGAIRDYNNNIDNYNYNNNGNFKTRRCFPHYRGTCSRGRQCSFAHSEAELLNNNNSQINFKPEICRNLIRGNCSFGFQCRFAHSEPELFSCNNNNNNNDLAVSHRSSRKQWVVVTRTAEQQQQPQTQQTVPHSLAEFG